MSRGAGERRGSTKRERRLRASVAGTVFGLVGLTAAALWVSARQDTDLGDPNANVTSREREAVADAPPIRFSDVAAERGVIMRHGPGERGRTLPEDTGSGLAWGDIDGDGDFDLYVVNFPGRLGAEPVPEGSNRLFRNDGGRFADVTEEAGVGDLDGFGMGAFFADYDADGDVDLYVTNLGPNRLFRNDGDGRFDQVAAAAGVDDPAWSTGAAWGDVDRDGDLDLYVANYVDYQEGGFGADQLSTSSGGEATIPFTLNPNAFDPVSNRLYLNRGDGTFEEVAAALGVDDPQGRGFAVTMCDLDGDGWLDLYVNNDVSTNRLFRNVAGDREDGTLAFQDLSTLTGIADPRGSMGLSVADLGDQSGGPPDGWPDLFITHWVAQENAFYFGAGRTGAGAWEYRDRTRDLGLGEISTDVVGWGSVLADLDLDGRLDLAVANGSTLEMPDDPKSLQAEPPFLLWNDGSRFHDVASKAGPGVDRAIVGRGLAAADFDSDGDVDLAISVNRGAPILLRNETETGNRSLVVTLDAPASRAFGARVELVTRSGSQIRWWGADVGFLGSHAAEMIFGLGTATAAESLSVSWIGGGETRLEGVPAGAVRVRP